ncbi:MAG: AlwI family type II restriction endonuclease [Eubacteriales bacterium]|nr:AlwI family type II restriction endonuclease [Eubacteriales bacterium]
MPNALAYRSYCWSLGTTSFRTKNFNKTIEEQLALLDEFWTLGENRNETWAGNAALQTRYYDFMRAKGFVEGEAGNKPKDGREKTSGLVDIGLIDGGRRLTNAGKALLRISAEGDFSPDGRLGIARDSYIYLKQLLKTYYTVDGHTVRPFLVLLHLLDRFGYLTLDEYTYLLPLCIGERETEEIARGIGELRAGNTSVDDIITGRLLDMPNYKAALTYLLENEVTEELICEIGFNRKSRRYDRPYCALYNALFETFVNKRTECIPSVYLAAGKINIGSWWRGYLFDTASAAAIRKDPAAHLRPGVFDDVTDEESFKRAFFNTMHLFKAKATLADYLDLNRRYIRTTDIVLFEDGTIS